MKAALQEEDDGRVWAVPLSWTAVGAAADWNVPVQAWLTQPHLQTQPDPALAGQPFVLNPRGTGYYRVNYSNENWAALAAVLRTDPAAIHPLSRAQLICDAEALTRAGWLSESVRDDILSYVDNGERVSTWSKLGQN